MGRGSRQGGNRRGGNRGGRGGRQGGSGTVIAPNAETGTVTLKAELEFFEKLADKACPAAITHGTDGVLLKLESWKELPALMGWFREGLTADEAAELSFSSKLNKQQRALVHSAAESVSQGGLESVSRGVGDDRYVTVLRKGRAEAMRAPLNEKQEHKAYWIWRWAQQGGFEVSRDEVAEMVQQGSMKPELEQLWAVKSAQQRALQRLCAAAEAGDGEAIKGLVDANPGLLAEGMFDLQTGVAPLHMAAKAGQLGAMQQLLDLGAGLDWRDGAGLTALQVSRKFDQSDAEGMLLRAGARDPDAPHWPGEAAAPALYAEPAPPAANGTTGATYAAVAAAGKSMEGHSEAVATSEQLAQEAAAATAAPGPALGGQAAAPAAATAELGAAADGATSSPRSVASSAAGSAASVLPPAPASQRGHVAMNGLLPHHSPRSVDPSEGDSESVLDSAASVCGTDISRNVGDVASIAGDSLADGLSEAAMSPRGQLGYPSISGHGGGLEAVGEQPNEEGKNEEELENKSEEASEQQNGDEAGEGESIFRPGSVAGSAGHGSISGSEAAGEDYHGVVEVGRVPAVGSAEAAGTLGKVSGGSASMAAQRAQLLGDYLLRGGISRRFEDTDLESTRSLCGSEMTYQQSLDMDRASVDLSIAAASPSAGAAKLPPAPEESAAEEEEAAAELAASVAAAAAAAAAAEVTAAAVADAPVATPSQDSSSCADDVTAAPATATEAAALAAGRAVDVADSNAQKPDAGLAAPVCKTEITAAVEDAKPLTNGQQQQQHHARGAAKQGAVWGVTGNAQVDTTITEWGEWALSHKGSLLAGAGVVVGLVLVLGGNRRRFIGTAP